MHASTYNLHQDRIKHGIPNFGVEACSHLIFRDLRLAHPSPTSKRIPLISGPIALHNNYSSQETTPNTLPRQTLNLNRHHDKPQHLS